MTTRTALAARATMVAIGLHAAAVVALAVVGAADGPFIDVLRPVPIVLLYAAPAVLAAVGVRRRRPLLLVAAIATAALALLPFSLHSFVLGPAAVAYLITYVGSPAQGHASSRVAVATLVSPLLLIAALAALLIEDHPACYAQEQSGEIRVDRDPESVTSGAQGSAASDASTVSSGCTSDTVVWWEALASLGLASLALVASIKLVPPQDPTAARRRYLLRGPKGSG